MNENFVKISKKKYEVLYNLDCTSRKKNYNNSGNCWVIIFKVFLLVSVKIKNQKFFKNKLVKSVNKMWNSTIHTTAIFADGLFPNPWKEINVTEHVRITV